MSKWMYLIVFVGLILISVAYLTIAQIPKDARQVYGTYVALPDSETGDKSWFINNREWYYQAHLIRMYIQNFYLAMTGLVLLHSGFRTLHKESRKE